MQQIDAVIQTCKLNEVRDALEELGVGEFMESSVHCHSQQNRQAMSFRGATFVANIAEKVKLEVIAADEAVEKVVAVIGRIARTDNREDCRIAVRSYQEVI